MCLGSHFYIIEIRKLIVGHRYIYYAKKIKFFRCVAVKFLVEK